MISLGKATRQIQGLLPGSVTEEQMDAYLDKSFMAYKGVPELIEWCLSKGILFMINTTGMMGFFQRVFAKRLLPPVPVVSAHPMIQYPKRGSDPHLYNLLEIQDKGKNTEAAVRSWRVPGQRIILIGDSGGDGPHFEWGAKCGVFLIGSMTKPSLESYCQEKGIAIDARFGLSYAQGETSDLEKEMKINFMDLSFVIEEFLAR
jgi:hypothetical protein